MEVNMTTNKDCLDLHEDFYSMTNSKMEIRSNIDRNHQ